MSSRRYRWLPWAIWALTLALLMAAFELWWLSDPPQLLRENLLFAPISMAYATVGALIASRQPRNPIGWIFGISTAISAFGDCAQAYALYSASYASGALPGGAVMAWAGAWTRILGSNGIFITLLLLPTGRLLSPRWRPVLWLTVVAMVLHVGLVSVQPGPFWFAPMINNPLGIEPVAPTLAALERLADISVGLFVGVAALSLILRFWRSSGIERQQLKWIAGAAMLPIAFIGSGMLSALLGIPVPQHIGDWMFYVILLSFPVSVGIAILKYRLYDIDIIINRTLVYGTLTVLLGLIYAGSIVLVQTLLRPFVGTSSQLATVASTLAIAALFHPLRRRVQALIDRGFYRRKYDAAQTFAAFSARLRHETDLQTLTEDLIQVVRDSLQTTHVSLWLRDDQQAERDAGHEVARIAS